MHIKHIHCMIEKLSECAKWEFDKGIESIDTEEMGKVADILKDLCEAEYYATITKAMDESEYGVDYDEDGRKGYRGQPRSSRTGRYMRRGYEEMMPMSDMEHMRDMDRGMGHMYYPENMHDAKEGRSGQFRKGYMEAKEMHRGNSPEEKKEKMKELEKYMQELGTDITEMITDASPEEKNMLKAKLQTLMTKIQ